MNNNLIILSIFVITFLVNSNLHAKPKINGDKEAAICLEILEYNSKNNFREKLGLKKLPKEESFKEVFNCVQILTQLKSDNRWKTCIERFNIDPNYKQGTNNKTDEMLRNCILEKW